jgi:hypothetical protein
VYACLQTPPKLGRVKTPDKITGAAHRIIVSACVYNIVIPQCSVL